MGMEVMEVMVVMVVTDPPDREQHANCHNLPPPVFYTFQSSNLRTRGGEGREKVTEENYKIVSVITN